jgi:hypothetical protein
MITANSIAKRGIGAEKWHHDRLHQELEGDTEGEADEHTAHPALGSYVT